MQRRNIHRINNGTGQTLRQMSIATMHISRSLVTHFELPDGPTRHGSGNNQDSDTHAGHSHSWNLQLALAQIQHHRRPLRLRGIPPFNAAGMYGARVDRLESLPLSLPLPLDCPLLVLAGCWLCPREMLRLRLELGLDGGVLAEPGRGNQICCTEC